MLCFVFVWLLLVRFLFTVLRCARGNFLNHSSPPTFFQGKQRTFLKDGLVGCYPPEASLGSTFLKDGVVGCYAPAAPLGSSRRVRRHVVAFHSMAAQFLAASIFSCIGRCDTR